jgi:hypothetical protein
LPPVADFAESSLVSINRGFGSGLTFVAGTVAVELPNNLLYKLPKKEPLDAGTSVGSVLLKGFHHAPPLYLRLCVFLR